MFDHQASLLALRNRALTLSVVTTGSLATLTATATGYHRSSGSFVTDGFLAGMEVTPSGFTSNTTAGLIEAVSASDLTIEGGATAETPGGSAALTVAFPAVCTWDNIEATPQQGHWWADEQYLPGPVQGKTVGPLADLEVRPTYVLTLYGMAKYGAGALYKAADALVNLFPPRDALTLSTGDVLRVRSDVAPSRGQLRHTDPGWAAVPVTVPLWSRTSNSL